MLNTSPKTVTAASLRALKGENTAVNWARKPVLFGLRRAICVVSLLESPSNLGRPRMAILAIRSGHRDLRSFVSAILV